MDSVSFSPAIHLSPFDWWASNGITSYWLSRFQWFSSGLGLCFCRNLIVFRVYTSFLGLSLLNVFRKFLEPQLEVQLESRHTQSVISLLFRRNCIWFLMSAQTAAAVSSALKCFWFVWAFGLFVTTKLFQIFIFRYLSRASSQ